MQMYSVLMKIMVGSFDEKKKRKLAQLGLYTKAQQLLRPRKGRANSMSPQSNVIKKSPLLIWASEC